MGKKIKQTTTNLCQKSLTTGLLEGGVAYLMIVLYDTGVAFLTIGFLEGGVAYLIIVLYDRGASSLTISLREGGVASLDVSLLEGQWPLAQ